MENMKKYSFWMHPEMIEKIEKALPYSYDSNRSSFVRSAVNFYIGYLMHKQSVDYIAPMINNEIKNQVLSSVVSMLANMFSVSAKKRFDNLNNQINKKQLSKEQEKRLAHGLKDLSSDGNYHNEYEDNQGFGWSM